MERPPVSIEDPSGAVPAAAPDRSKESGAQAVGVSAGAPWRGALIPLGATILATLLLHVSTIRSMARVWTENESFSHCWFVPPLSAYMIWTRRHDLASVLPRPSLWGVLLALGSGALWLVSYLAQVGTGEQVALVGMILGSVWAVLGTEVCRRIAYPLAFLALMVPFGEGLFPVLISIAGRLAVMVLEWTGMPVTFDGRFLRVPRGEWTITEACSGLRYLLTILTVGAVFAYVNYRRPLKRALFLGLCVVTAIAMNGIRVWVLVIIGAISDMKSPLVKDHASLGWVLFAIMLIFLFWIGRRMADRGDASPPSEAQGFAAPERRRAAPAGAFWVASVVLIALGGTWTAVARGLDRPIAGVARYEGPSADPSWTQLAYHPWIWKPVYLGTAVELQRAYERGGEVVGLYVGYYRDQKPGAELIQAWNILLDPIVAEKEGWKHSALTHRDFTGKGAPIPVTQVDIEGPGTHLRVWRLYWAGGRFAGSENQVKLEQLRTKLSGKGDDAAVLMIYTTYDGNGDAAVERLTEFLKAHREPLERSLWYTSGGGPAEASAG